MATQLDGDVTITGGLTIRGALPAITRSSLVQETYSAFAVPLTSLRVFDDFKTAIATPGTSDDDLGFSQGVFGTGVPYVSAGDVKAVTKTRKARFVYQVPMNYVAGQVARFSLYAGTLTTISDTTTTLDLEVFKQGSNTLITGSDLYVSSAQSIRSLTFADIQFDLTVTSLSPGDYLDVLITIASVDAATVTAVTPAIAKIQFQAATKG